MASLEHEPIPAHVEAIAAQVVDAALKVHRALGPGPLESAYETCLCHEISKRGLVFEQQRAWPITYGGIDLDSGFRLDLLVEKQVVVELKAVDRLIPLYQAQLLTYLKLTGLRLGLLINFNAPRLKDGITRLVR